LAVKGDLLAAGKLASGKERRARFLSNSFSWKTGQRQRFIVTAKTAFPATVAKSGLEAKPVKIANRTVGDQRRQVQPGGSSLFRSFWLSAEVMTTLKPTAKCVDNSHLLTSAAPLDRIDDRVYSFGMFSGLSSCESSWFGR
jgi:hypothetical protein